MKLRNQIVQGFCYFLILSFGLSTTACSKELSRSKAVALIEKTPQLEKARHELPLNADGFQKGLTQGMWIHYYQKRVFVKECG